jgi:hypothetical protein
MSMDNVVDTQLSEDEARQANSPGAGYAEAAVRL